MNLDNVFGIFYNYSPFLKKPLVSFKNQIKNEIERFRTACPNENQP